MYRADGSAIASGISGDELMEAAGAAVAREIVDRFAPCRVAVLAGPGNNGGDGFVAARYLQDAGWDVRVELLGPVDRLKGDAALNAARWKGTVTPLDPDGPSATDLVIDALFGAGLARPVDGIARSALEAVVRRNLPVVAVDVPSGVHGDSGAILGYAAQAALTITFFRSKPGHHLMPGRGHRGTLIVADIGIPDAVLPTIRPTIFRNGPSLFMGRFPIPGLQDHKYTRGHAVVVGGQAMTGAARLATRAARRVGAGLVTIAAQPAAIPLYALDAPGALTAEVTTSEQFQEALSDPRRNAVLVGPGNGISVQTADRALTALRAGKACVLDADALTVFEEEPDILFDAISGAPCVLTPHEGEFKRLFPGRGDKILRVRSAARQSGAVVVLKGADTVVADPQGRVAINDNAPAYLATAGSGDVLAGMIVGLLAQGMPVVDAACAGVWLHGDAGRRSGPGLIAEDLTESVRHPMIDLYKCATQAWRRDWET